MKQHKQLYIIFTYYQLLISLIETARHPDKENNFIIWNLNNSFNTFIDGLKDYPFVNKLMVLPHELNDFTKRAHSIKKYYNYFGYNTEHYAKYIDFKELDSWVENSEINIYLMLDALPLFLLRRYPNNYFRLIEEGEVTYARSKTTIISWVKRNVYKLPLNDFRCKAVKEIWVKFPERLDEDVQYKTSYYDSQQAFLDLDKDVVKQIIKVFNANDLFELFEGEQKNMLLLTQPLAEDKLLTVDQKIEAYKKIVAEYGKDFNLVIKIHPREKTNYKEVFPDAKIIRSTFPIELFNVMDITFERGVTIFSSAIYNLNGIKEKIFLGSDWSEALAKNLKKQFK